MLRKDDPSHDGRLLHLQLFSDEHHACETTDAEMDINQWNEDRIAGVFSFGAFCPGNDRQVWIGEGKFDVAIKPD